MFFLILPQLTQGQESNSIKLVSQLMMPFSGGPRDDGSSAALNDIGYYGLGNNQYFEVQKDWWAYFPLEDRWEQRSDIPGSPRQYCTSFSSNRSVFVFGGILDDGTIVSELLEYDPESDLWTVHSTPVDARAKAFGFQIGDNYYLGAGQNDTMALGDFWRYNLPSKSWTNLDSLPFSPRYDMVAFASEGIGYSCLGQDSNETFNTCWEFQVATNTWREVASFTGQARTYATALGGAFGCIVYGGQSKNGELLSEIYSFDKSSNKWSREIDLTHPDVRGMEEGHFLVGGLTHNFTRVSAVQRYGIDEEAQRDQLKVWPNPTRSLLSIYIDEHAVLGVEDILVQLFDVHGMMIAEADITGQKNFRTLDTESLNNGIYYLRITAQGYSIVEAISVMK